MDLERRSIRIRGVVQGVGFRPAMYRLADGLGLGGFVRNDREGVWLEVEGSAGAIQRFLDGVRGAAPPASRIDDIETAGLSPQRDGAFRIAESPVPASAGEISGAEGLAAAIPVDLAPCAACLAELDDPADRRHRYPFINCTACGPRFTIVRDVPYDRPKTTMAAFEMCAACHAEYRDPRDRRFHAEPNACPACGPRARFLIGGEEVASGDAAVRAAAAAIAAGQIVAVKGAGGFVLAADAANEGAVARLRLRKRRPHKAFAVMARSLDHAEEIAVIDDPARALLRSPARPIVLVPARTAAIGTPIAPSVAPGLADLGIYLPPTPLQHLLLRDGPPLQVMTSGNLAEEPIARTNEEALAKLAGLADAFLVHDREVHARADDSVVRLAERPIPMRRARGHVPETIALPVHGPCVLAAGAHERNTVCLARGGVALLSQHIGDLDHPETDRFFREAIARVTELAGAEPEVVAHDLHPDYRSTRWALASGLRRIAVQHHHAHVAACLAEHGRSEKVTGIVFDGTGLGDDGQLWGGEVLSADLGSFRRVGHLRPIALAGGEAAIREPWRLAVAALIDADLSLDILGRVSMESKQRIARVLATTLPPRATGAGRWFDAVAALLGVASQISYDGQAAAELEAIADGDAAAPFELAVLDHPGGAFEIDLRPMVRELATCLRRGIDTRHLSARFHATMARAAAFAAHRAQHRTVALTGGCFQNRRLAREARRLLSADGFEVLTHERVPPNDGGIALGQAAIASYRLASERSDRSERAERSRTEPCV